jgi:hypothetical protein
MRSDGVLVCLDFREDGGFVERSYCELCGVELGFGLAFFFGVVLQ